MKRQEGIDDPLVILDRFTMKEVARFATIKEAAVTLELNVSSIRHAVCLRIPVYQCYWVFASELSVFVPRPSAHIRVHGVKISPKLQLLIDKV
jgi:hypothetical protein